MQPLHPKNRYQGRYQIKKMIEEDPELAAFAKANASGEPSIDFANAAAVKALNRALLKQYYQIMDWDIPAGYLCPPIPSRADYIHHLADLLAVNTRAQGRELDPVRVLDVGVGANCIYPIIGQSEYGWKFVGSDIDEAALASAARILAANPKLEKGVELRRQMDRNHVFEGIIRDDERFELTMCNPPFHGSADEAAAVNERKWRNLGKAPVANFGGQNAELWCVGGEVALIRTMIQESVRFKSQCLWFTSYVSKKESLPLIYAALGDAKVLEYRVIDMAQGQKRSRFVAWTFLGGKSNWKPA